MFPKAWGNPDQRLTTAAPCCSLMACTVLREPRFPLCNSSQEPQWRPQWDPPSCVSLHSLLPFSSSRRQGSKRTLWDRVCCMLYPTESPGGLVATQIPAPVRPQGPGNLHSCAPDLGPHLRFSDLGKLTGCADVSGQAPQGSQNRRCVGPCSPALLSAGPEPPPWNPGAQDMCAG